VILYGLFLSKSNPTIAIAMIIAITPIAMKVIRFPLVATSVNGAAVGAGVAAARSTAKAVTE